MTAQWSALRERDAEAQWGAAVRETGPFVRRVLRLLEEDPAARVRLDLLDLAESHAEGAPLRVALAALCRRVARVGIGAGLVMADGRPAGTQAAARVLGLTRQTVDVLLPLERLLEAALAQVTNERLLAEERHENVGGVAVLAGPDPEDVDDLDEAADDGEGDES